MDASGNARFSVAHTFPIYLLTITAQFYGQIGLNWRCQLCVILVDSRQHGNEVSPTATAPRTVLNVAGSDFANGCASLHLPMKASESRLVRCRHRTLRTKEIANLKRIAQRHALYLSLVVTRYARAGCVASKNGMITAGRVRRRQNLESSSGQ